MEQGAGDERWTEANLFALRQTMRCGGWGVVLGVLVTFRIGPYFLTLWLGAVVASIGVGAVREFPISAAARRWWAATVVALDGAAVASIALVFTSSRLLLGLAVVAGAAVVPCYSFALAASGTALAIPTDTVGIIAICSTLISAAYVLVVGLASVAAGVPARLDHLSSTTTGGSYRFVAGGGWLVSAPATWIVAIIGLTAVVTLATQHRWMARALDENLEPVRVRRHREGVF